VNNNNVPDMAYQGVSFMDVPGAAEDEIKTVKGPSESTQTGNDFLQEADREFKRMLEKTFEKSNRNKYNEIINAIEAEDFVLAHRLAHTLKSSAGQIGKKLLQKAAANIEHELKDGKNSVTQEMLAELQTELNAVLNELAQVSGETEVKAKTFKNESAVSICEPQEIKKLFETLESLLIKGNPECNNYAESLSRICAGPENEELIQQLIQQMDDFEFAAALVTIGKFKI